jgi:uncharacterized protein involved in exopolysaccharide biosynthesis
MPHEDLVPARESAPTPTLRELAMVLFRRRKVVICVSGLVLAAAVVYAFAGKKHEANMKVLVRRGRANAPATAEENAPLDLTRMVITEEELNSEVELLRDDEVLRRVVQETGLDVRDWFHFLRMGEGNAERVERATRRLARKLEVEPVKKTNLIAISYAADDPQTAARVLQSVEKVYLEKHMEVHRPTDEYRFFEQQTSESRRQLEESKRKLLDFTTIRGAVAAAEQRDLALQKLSEIQP